MIVAIRQPLTQSTSKASPLLACLRMQAVGTHNPRKQQSHQREEDVVVIHCQAHHVSRDASGKTLALWPAPLSRGILGLSPLSTAWSKPRYSHRFYIQSTPLIRTTLGNAVLVRISGWSDKPGNQQTRLKGSEISISIMYVGHEPLLIHKKDLRSLVS